MAGLCEGGNEPSGSLKAKESVTALNRGRYSLNISNQVSVEAKQLDHLYLSIDQDTSSGTNDEPAQHFRPPYRTRSALLPAPECMSHSITPNTTLNVPFTSELNVRVSSVNIFCNGTYLREEKRSVCWNPLEMDNLINFSEGPVDQRQVRSPLHNGGLLRVM
ncbi:hypothetical protein ANN_12127 [Periplaneta americana]|uniref:Uncharacterized protein n=1 Tax=Periplaneta americana TaxID=6978 RepID=A0ABQ8T8H4_PERAM|nr:hypothetical protein ANN_12127 [Periplaneta americana]